MSLANLIEDKYDLTTSAGVVTLYGLSIEGLSVLLKDNKEELSALFEGTADIDDFLAKAPDFVAKMIAMGCREPDMVAVAKNLPMGVQLRAIEKIWELTAVSAEDLGKMVRSLVGGLQVVGKSLPPSSNGAKN